MTAQSPPFALQNASHSAALFRQAAFSAWRNASGIVGPTDFAVTAQGTPNMSVIVAAGRAWMKGTQVASVSGGNWSTQAAYFGINDAPVTLTIAAADPTNPRIDVICAYVQDAFYSGSTNTLTLGVVTGTPAPSPAAPAAPNNALVLATVAVAANATSITSGNITQASALLTIARGGILPVVSTDVTAGEYVGQYRDFPTHTSSGAGGLQRWNGTTWQPVSDLDFPVAALRATAAQGGLAAGWAALNMNTADIDTHSGWSSGTPTRWTCPAGQGGTYAFEGGMTVNGPAAGSNINAQLRKNGTALASSWGNSLGTAAVGAAGVGTDRKVVTLAAGDYVELFGYYSAGTWQTYYDATIGPWLSVERIR